MDWLLYLLAFVLGCLCGTYRDRVWRSSPPPVAVPQGCAPKGGTAVLVDASGVDVSRRRLVRDESRITRPHGRGANDTFVYVGPRPNGDHEFRMTR